MKRNKLGRKPDDKINDKWKETPEMLPKSWHEIEGQARRRWVLAKASCNGSWVINAARYFDSFSKLCIRVGEQGGFALSLFCCCCFVFYFGLKVCFIFSFLNENLSQRQNQQRLSLFQSQEVLKLFFPPQRRL